MFCSFLRVCKPFLIITLYKTKVLRFLILCVTRNGDSVEPLACYGGLIFKWIKSSRSRIMFLEIWSILRSYWQILCSFWSPVSYSWQGLRSECQPWGWVAVDHLFSWSSSLWMVRSAQWCSPRLDCTPERRLFAYSGQFVHNLKDSFVLLFDVESWKYFDQRWDLTPDFCFQTCFGWLGFRLESIGIVRAGNSYRWRLRLEQ